MAAGGDVLDVNIEDQEFQSDDDEQNVDQMRTRATRKKGRGFGQETGTEVDDYEGMDVVIDDTVTEGPGPQRSVEGWILFVTNVHEEAQEEDIYDKFSEYGEIKNMHLNLDRRTGFLKGYALVEYETFKEAQAAIDALNGEDLLGQKLSVDWCFVKAASKKGRKRR